MSATIIKADKDEAVFLIEIDAATMEKALMEEYNKAKAAGDKDKAADKKAAPTPAYLSNKALLAQYPELDKIASQALEKLMPSYYTSAIRELGLRPATFPKMMPRPGELGKPCVVEIRVVLEPEIELKKYEGLEATYTPVIVTEEDMAQQMAGLRKQHGAENDDAKLLEKLPFDSVEALTTEIRNSLISMAKDKTDFYRKEAVAKALIEANPFTLSEEIIEQHVMMEINQISQQMGPQFMQNYLKTSGRTLDDLKKEVRPQAELKVKKNLILSAIAEKISDEVTEDDIKEAILKQPGSVMELGMDYETRRKNIEAMPGALDQIKHSIRLEKAMDYVVSKAVLSENKPVSITDELPEYMKQ